MISKETFVNTMNKLQDLDKKMDAVDKALKALDSDFRKANNRKEMKS